MLVDLLIKSGCKTREEITIKKIKLERKEALANIGKDLDIGDFIKLGIGEKKQKIGNDPKTLAETLEALIGAIYIDSGFDTSKEVITRLFEKRI